jgi:protein TonB
MGAALVLAVVIHAGALALILYYSPHHLVEKPKATEVVFKAAFVPALPLPPPPPPAGGAATPKVDQPKKPPVVKKPEALVEPEQKEPEKPAGQQAGVQGGDSVRGVEGGDAIDGREGGVRDGGVPGGHAAGTGTATAGPAPTYETLHFGDGMTQPTLIGGSTQPVIPREATLAKVSGKIIAKCTITEAGTLVGCHIVKSLPFMDEAVLANLASRRYTPVIYQGHPQRVHFTFYITVKAE